MNTCVLVRTYVVRGRTQATGASGSAPLPRVRRKQQAASGAQRERRAVCAMPHPALRRVQLVQLRRGPQLEDGVGHADFRLALARRQLVAASHFC